jgi:PRTRC genetic system protein E
MFFKQLAERLGKNLTINFTIANVDDHMTASIIIKPFKPKSKDDDEDDSPFAKLPPFTVKGTPDEFDEDFFNNIGHVFNKMEAGLKVDLEQFDKAADVAIEENKEELKKEAKKTEVKPVKKNYEKDIKDAIKADQFDDAYRLIEEARVAESKVGGISNATAKELKDKTDTAKRKKEGLTKGQLIINEAPGIADAGNPEDAQKRLDTAIRSHRQKKIFTTAEVVIVEQNIYNYKLAVKRRDLDDGPADAVVDPTVSHAAEHAEETTAEVVSEETDETEELTIPGQITPNVNAEKSFESPEEERDVDADTVAQEEVLDEPQATNRPALDDDF